jgi:hypothetical protein
MALQLVVCLAAAELVLAAQERAARETIGSLTALSLLQV